MKYNTAAIKELITKILDNKGEDLKDFYDDEYPIDELINDFIDGNRWARAAKHNLSSEVFSKESAREELKEFINGDLDCCFIDNENIDKFSDEQLMKCNYRYFVPKNEILLDNFRFEIVTSADDTILLAYQLVSD